MILRCCYLFYQEDRDINEIAKYLDISRFRVSRYLREGRERGIVQIQLRDPNIEYEKLALELERALELKRVTVVPTAYEGEMDRVRAAVGQAASELFAELNPGTSVGITWGRTIAQMVASLPSQGLKAERVVELAGGFGEVSPGVSGYAVASRFAEKLGAECVHLPAPIIVQDPQTARSLLVEKSIQHTLELAALCDLAIIGIGPMDADSLMLRSTSLSDQDFAELEKAGAVGSILGHFFDANGEECNTPYRDRAISLSLDSFRSIKERMTVGPGTNKVNAILGLARGKLITSLVIDNTTAERLLAASQ